MPQQFNLVTEPWLPVIDLNGRRSVRCLADVTANADRIRRVDLADPLERTASIRLLTAIHMAAGDMTDDDYLETVRNRFDVMDPEHPFLQTPGLDPAGHDTGRALSVLHPLMQRHLWEPAPPTRPITPARAAIRLVSCMMFDVAGVHTGMQGDPAVYRGKASSRGLAQAADLFLATIRGADLAETIRLNSVRTDPGDRPVWELDPPTPGEKRIRSTGPCMTAVWPSRLIRLVWRDGMCANAFVTYAERPDETRENNPTAFWDTKKDRPAHMVFNTLFDQPLWAQWGQLMTPGNRPITFETAPREFTFVMNSTRSTSNGAPIKAPWPASAKTR